MSSHSFKLQKKVSLETTFLIIFRKPIVILLKFLTALFLKEKLKTKDVCQFVKIIGENCENFSRWKNPHQIPLSKKTMSLLIKEDVG